MRRKVLGVFSCLLIMVIALHHPQWFVYASVSFGRPRKGWKKRCVDQAMTWSTGTKLVPALASVGIHRLPGRSTRSEIPFLRRRKI